MSLILTKPSKNIIFEAVRAVAKIYFNLKLNHHNQIKLVQIPVPHFGTCVKLYDNTVNLTSMLSKPSSSIVFEYINKLI